MICPRFRVRLWCLIESIFLQLGEAGLQVREVASRELLHYGLFSLYLRLGAQDGQCMGSPRQCDVDPLGLRKIGCVKHDRMCTLQSFNQQGSRKATGRWATADPP